MTDISEKIRDLEAKGIANPGEIEKMAASALKLEIGERAMHPVEALKEMVGIKKPLHRRAVDYIREGITIAKPKAALKLLGVGTSAAIALGGLMGVKALQAKRIRDNMKSLQDDPEVQEDMAKAMAIAQVVKRWAPSVASDPDVLKGTVKNLMKFPDSYMTHDVAKKLTDTEKGYQAAHGVLGLIKRKIL